MPDLDRMNGIEISDRMDRMEQDGTGWAGGERIAA
jgi:hypothetical protein